VRLFAAVYPPEERLDALAAAVAELDLAGWRAVPRHQWHLTVAFFGDVPDARVEALAERLRRAAGRTPPLALQLSGAGTFPRQAKRARQFWIGLDGDLVELRRLADRCVAAGRREGVPMEERPYRPHVTLARAPGKNPADATLLVERLSTYAGGPFEIRHLHLVQSTLGSRIHHESVGVFPLMVPRSPP
jgi:2'-5' RNA ligase